MHQQFAGLKARMFFEGCRKMRNGRITQHDGNLGNGHTFFVKKIFGMLHPLALVKIENGGAEHFLESLFQVAFIHRHLATKLPDSNGLTNMLQQHFPCFLDLFPVRIIGKELAADDIDLLVLNTIQAV